MSYKEFLKNIDEFVGKTVEFTVRFKDCFDGKIFKMQRYVWDSKEFGEPKEESSTEILEVKVI